MVTTELVHRPQGTTQLIVADTAGERVAQATEIATALDSVIRAQGMRTKVGSQKRIDPATGEQTNEWIPRWHVNVEGWQTLATLLGLAVVPAWTRKVIDPSTGKPGLTTFTVREKTTKGQGERRTVTEREYEVSGYDWEARVEVFKDGALIGAGESMCARTEKKWKESDDYAVRGMAQTRATSRAIGAAAKWIVTLAGYAATPAEEMDAVAVQEAVEIASPKLAEKMKAALSFLLDSAEATEAAWEQIRADNGGVIPRQVGRGIVFVAAILKAQAEAPAEAADETAVMGGVAGAEAE
jgi:hypothetical protein